MKTAETIKTDREDHVEEMRYPNSVMLFKFCRRVLDFKYGGVRVIDQDVGQILGFDPADCSHWKKGKKNIRSIQAIKSISEHLNVDETIVMDIALGGMSDSEAYFEFTGYGNLTLDTKLIENAKKEYYRKNIESWSKQKELEFKNQFQINLDLITSTVEQIHKKINFEESPLFLPEICAHYPDLVLSPVQEPKDVSVVKTENRNHIQFEKGTENKPYIRYQIAKKMSSYFLPEPENQPPEFAPYREQIQEVESNLFATLLLVPEVLLKKEIQKLDISKDMIHQLASAFWVSKMLMNRRLKDLLAG